MIKTIIRIISAIIAFAFFYIPSNAQGNIDSYIPVQPKTDPNTFVVIIANEQYQYEQEVPFAHNDGQIFKLYCENALGIPLKNINYIEDATLNHMRMKLHWLKQIMTAFNGEARAIMYYSGHGMPDDEGKHSYLLPVDGQSIIPESGLKTAELYDILAEIPSESTLVLLDACFSGAKRDGQMLSSSRGVAIKVKEEPVKGNVVVFSAAQGNETAYPYKEKGHGLFTYFILEQLHNNGGRISLGDMADYVIKNVNRTSIYEYKKSQTPSITASSNVKNWRSWQFAYTMTKQYKAYTVNSPMPETNWASEYHNKKANENANESEDKHLPEGKLTNTDLEKEELLKIRAKEKVGQFCDYVSFIATKKKDLKTRFYYIDKAKDLFLNKGKALYDDDGLMVRDSVIMQVTSLKAKIPKNVYLNSYLPNLAKLKYPEVEVTSTDVAEMKVSNLQKISDGLYTCTVYFYQYFIGKTKDNQVIYKDKTNKSVQCFIQEETTEDGMEYIVLLGDIYANTTKSF